ncbi:MAG: hypothetical protein CFE43_21035 [Burkholderiales bacterium PBB3]|nr:MAG: hypothetical protein CFE43_21035 [Burkholderiales bacterium PBB3]
MKMPPANLNVAIHKPPKSYVLAQPCVPQALDISAQLLQGLQVAEQSLTDLAVTEASQVKRMIAHLASLSPEQQGLHVRVAALRHSLGKNSISRCYADEQGIPWRWDLERRVLDQTCESLLHSLVQPNADAFIREILAISALVKGMPSTTFRTSGVRLAGDKGGWCWQFPDSQGITSCLTALHEALFQTRFENGIVEATIAYGILNWMHPFGDGNGRTSRIVFNAILRRAGMPKGQYIPIKEINYLAHGGHEVRLRYTVATGDWEELLEYFVNVLDFCKVVLHQEVTAADCRA